MEDIGKQVDPHWERLAGRAIHIPEVFSTFTGFNDWKAQKRKQPRLTAEELEVHVSGLADTLMLPWFTNSQFSQFRDHVSDLCDRMNRYLHYLESKLQDTKSNQPSSEPVRSMQDA